MAHDSMWQRNEPEWLIINGSAEGCETLWSRYVDIGKTEKRGFC